MTWHVALMHVRYYRVWKYRESFLTFANHLPASREESVRTHPLHNAYRICVFDLCNAVYVIPQTTSFAQKRAMPFNCEIRWERYLSGSREIYDQSRVICNDLSLHSDTIFSICEFIVSRECNFHEHASVSIF